MKLPPVVWNKIENVNSSKIDLSFMTRFLPATGCFEKVVGGSARNTHIIAWSIDIVWLRGVKVTMTLSMLGNLGKLTPALIALIIRKVLFGSMNLAYLDALFAGLPLCLQRMSLSGSIIAKFGEGINALICMLGETNWSRFLIVSVQLDEGTDYLCMCRRPHEYLLSVSQH